MVTLMMWCTLACVLIGTGLTIRMFRRDDEFAGLVGLSAFLAGACFAVVYGGLTS